MPTLAEFRDDPLMQSLSPDRAPDSIVLAFLELAEIELEGDRNCLGTHYDRCVILLAAHKTSKWNSAGMANSANVEELPLSEIETSCQISVFRTKRVLSRSHLNPKLMALRIKMRLNILQLLTVRFIGLSILLTNARDRGGRCNARP